MSRWQILYRIIAPQAFKIALPPLSNNFVSLVKDTLVGSKYHDCRNFMTAQRIAARTYEPLLLLLHGGGLLFSILYLLELFAVRT